MPAPPRRLAAEPPSLLERHRRRLVQELAFRAALAAVILGFDVVLEATAAGGSALTRGTALAGLLLNPLYYAAARTGAWRREQAYGRMLVDVAMITLGLYAAGGIAAAPYLAVYAIVPLYAGLGLSSAACLVAAVTGTVGYLAVGLGQELGWLEMPAGVVPNAWVIAAFNLTMVNVVGLVTARLSAVWRRSRHELAAAHEASLRLNAEIQRAGQLRVLGEVVAGVAHELRNVLTVAAGHLGLLRRQAGAFSPELRRRLDEIETSLDGALRIVASTLHTSQRTAAESGAVCLRSIAQRVVGLKAYDLRRAGIAPVIDFPEAFPAVHGVAFQLQQVLLNLVTNAEQVLAGAGAPRRIEIRGRVADARVIVEVSDTGPGISADALPRLFEPFFTTREEGTGLGLAISAGIIRDLGGRLTAENREEGGARFCIDLPAAV